MMAAFVITRTMGALHRDIALTNLTSALVALIPDSTWATPGVGEAEQVEERILINAAARQVTLSLAAVTWVQPVALAPLPAGVTLPISLYLSGDLDGEVGS